MEQLGIEHDYDLEAAAVESADGVRIFDAAPKAQPNTDGSAGTGVPADKMVIL